MFAKGNIIGVLELIDKVNKDTWKVRCTKCGKESFKKLSSLYWITKHPTNYCQECIKEVQKPIEPGEVVGTIKVLEKLSNGKFKVKCNNCGRVYQLCSATISNMRNKPPKFCSKCKNLSGIHTKYKKGDIIGNCYRLISLNKGSYWNVECTQCGKKLLLSIPNMKRHKSNKCYYCDHPNGLTNPKSAKRIHYLDINERIYNYYKRNVSGWNKNPNRKYKSFELSLEEFTKLIHGNCYYCGASPSTDNSWNLGSSRRTSLNEIVEINGIDRIDSSKGYTVDNCVSCCKVCNTIKMDLPIDVFKQHIIDIYNHFVEHADIKPIELLETPNSSAKDNQQLSENNLESSETIEIHESE